MFRVGAEAADHTDVQRGLPQEEHWHSLPRNKNVVNEETILLLATCIDVPPYLVLRRRLSWPYLFRRRLPAMKPPT